MTSDSGGLSEVETRLFEPLQDDLPLDAWQALSDAAADPNPFFGPAFLRPYLRHMSPGRVKLLAVTSRLTGQWLMAAPLRLRPAGLLVPVPTAFTTDYGPVGTPLLHPDAGAIHAQRFFSGGCRKGRGSCTPVPAACLQGGPAADGPRWRGCFVLPKALTGLATRVARKGMRNSMRRSRGNGERK